METKVCTCTAPRPVQVATRKGAAATVCGDCGRPMPLRLGSRAPQAA